MTLDELCTGTLLICFAVLIFVGPLLLKTIDRS